jgi:N-carbamoyl-L-amino-acid hydrolase
MQSGAGHDSQDMALIAPIGMIFVPSVAGISSPKEFSKAVDMANGANVLLQNHISIRHGLERSEVFLLITGRFDYLRSTIAIPLLI